MIIPDWAVGLIFSLRSRCKPTEKITIVNNIFMVRKKSRWELLKEYLKTRLALWMGQKGTSGLHFPEGKDNSRGEMKVNPSFTQRP